MSAIYALIGESASGMPLRFRSEDGKPRVAIGAFQASIPPRMLSTFSCDIAPQYLATPNIDLNGGPMGVRPGYRGFLKFADAVGLALEPFQRRIARAAIESRELLTLLPRGNGKSRLAGTLAVHDLLTTERPAIYVAAASRDQARVIYEYARDVAMHPVVSDEVIVRHLELRVAGGFLRVLASDAPTTGRRAGVDINPELDPTSTPDRGIRAGKRISAWSASLEIGYGVDRGSQPKQRRRNQWSTTSHE
jgi:hypothetical protein